MATFKGIILNGFDFASYQAGFDFTDCTGDFAIVKATQGTWYVNPAFEQLYDGAKQAGLLLGIYHYAEGGDPEREAEFFVQTCGERIYGAVLFLDWEGKSNPTFGTGKDAEWCRRFIGKIAELVGATCVPYMSKGVAAKYDWSPVCSVSWIAQYKAKAPTKFIKEPWTDEKSFGTMECIIYQYSSSGKYGGKTVDINGATLTKEQWAEMAVQKGAIEDAKEDALEPSKTYITVTIDPQKAMENLALAECGYVEKASNKNVYRKTANAGNKNWTKYGNELHELLPSVCDLGAPWCDAFYDWLCMKLFGTATAKSLLNGEFDDYTIASANMYIKHKAWVYGDFELGDQVFFSHDDTKVSQTYHTGMFLRYEDERTVTVEGNTSSASGVVANGGAVCVKTYNRRKNQIVGAGRPNWKLCGTLTHDFLCPMSLVEGMKGCAVRVWQMIVGATVDGAFGPNTAAKTVEWKRIHGLEETPVVEPETWSKALSDYVVTYGMPDVEAGSYGRSVKFLQAVVGAKADGVFGINTTRKLTAWQKAHGLTADGYASTGTWNKVFEMLAQNE